MTSREIRAIRAGAKFMPRLWAFAYPMTGRGYIAARRIALRLWCEAFALRVRLFDV